MTAPRFSLIVADQFHRADDLQDALRIVVRHMSVSESDIRDQLKDGGIARAEYRGKFCQIVDLLWRDTDHCDLDAQVLAYVRARFVGEPRVEVPDNPVRCLKDRYIVDVWLWVSESDAEFPEYCDDPDTMEQCYARAAIHPNITFDGSPDVIFDHGGAFVCGVFKVPFTCTPEAT